MILLADGGSTKCDWILLDDNGQIVFKTRTEGLNPAVFAQSLLEERIRKNAELLSHCNEKMEVHFFGAGCGTKKPSELLKNVFEEFFTNATVVVREDTVAAVYAATSEPGIVCILGTGSNSCYFDGENIHMPVPSLGYILMDEASGNYFGKRLIRDYYYKKMPAKIALAFEKGFNLSSDAIKENLYKKDNPNTYLASFAEFIFTNERDDYFSQIITEGIREFIETRIILLFKEKKVPVHFIGSIAHFSEDIIRKVASQYGITMGNIVRRPIDGLIEYYRKNVISKK